MLHDDADDADDANHANHANHAHDVDHVGHADDADDARPLTRKADSTQLWCGRADLLQPPNEKGRMLREEGELLLDAELGLVMQFAYRPDTLSVRFAHVRMLVAFAHSTVLHVWIARKVGRDQPIVMDVQAEHGEHDRNAIESRDELLRLLCALSPSVRSVKQLAASDVFVYQRMWSCIAACQARHPGTLEGWLRERKDVASLCFSDAWVIIRAAIASGCPQCVFAATKGHLKRVQESESLKDEIRILWDNSVMRGDDLAVVGLSCSPLGDGGPSLGSVISAVKRKHEAVLAVLRQVCHVDWYDVQHESTQTEGAHWQGSRFRLVQYFSSTPEDLVDTGAGKRKR